ncbi:MAG TPA: transposase [Thermoanaerobaculia bacterium]|nr:transposase [Thermoanaerobaculia bacterium]
MSMGNRGEKQRPMWVDAGGVSKGPGHPFYEALNRLLREQGFDVFVAERCRPFYADGVGRPSLPPAVYFRLLLIGYFEGIDSERGIAWRVADSLGLREFLGYELSESTPDHSTISRNRRRLPVEVHQEVFAWIVTVLGRKGLLRAKTLGVDATTLEANAALRSIVRRDSGESYREFLLRLAQESGIETPTREQLSRLDRKRKKKGSNQDWQHPHDPDARITKMKDGRTHLAHKAEHAVDLETGAVIAVTLQPADRGDTQSLEATLEEALENLAVVAEDEEASSQLSETPMAELVADKGYHSGGVLKKVEQLGLRTYLPEPDRGRRCWKDRRDEQALTYANRRRVRGPRGRQLLRLRGERLERGFAHGYDTGGMRRTHLRGHGNILKRLLVHLGGLNLGLVLRQSLGAGTPRGLWGRLLGLSGLPDALLARLRNLWAGPSTLEVLLRPTPPFLITTEPHEAAA